MKLALAQLNVEPADVEGNVSRAKDAIAMAAADGADLVALPELFNVGFFAFDSYQREAEPIGGQTHERISTAAREYGVGVLAGSIVEDLGETAASDIDVRVPAEEGLANTSVFFDRNGVHRATYRKHHLFGYESQEARLLTPGEAIETFDFEGFTIGMTTCYDLRFPELYRALIDEGVSLTLVPSAWPYPRVEHWMTLPRARAIENLSYVATINGSGSFEDAELCGRSTVFDPWGTTIASSDEDPTIVTATIEPERVEAVRDDFPALRDRRFNR